MTETPFQYYGIIRRGLFTYSFKILCSWTYDYEYGDHWVGTAIGYPDIIVRSHLPKNDWVAVAHQTVNHIKHRPDVLAQYIKNKNAN